MKSWTTDDIPPQNGRSAVVTGANSGIGYHTALELARKGARVVLACRSRTKGEAALAHLKAELPGAKAELAILDLSDLGSVRSFASALLDKGEPLDLLVNNAGIMALPERQATNNGFEAQFGTNHLGHFALTALLLPLLKKAPAPRVVTVSSIAHKSGKMDFDDLQAVKGYVPWKAYRQSKLANLLFAFELQRRADKNGLKLLSLGAHPGVAMTNLFIAGPGRGKRTLLTRLMELAAPLFWHTEDRGALPTLLAATSPNIVPGGYYGPNGWREMRGDPVRVRPEPQAEDLEAAARLWKLSEDLAGTGRWP
ncbi:MAG: short chain dehydrogenase [Elusimicrobia bacterium RIFOXYD12_FULL_66_9]|nr:MAG: short chain dehydrogenase [Elusimicrobia bacterium RIFOXYD12_FULL_66_9]